MKHTRPIALLLLVALLAACSSTSPEQFITAGELLLRTEAEKAICEKTHLWYPEWEEETIIAEVADEEYFPEWAQQQYATVVH